MEALIHSAIYGEVLALSLALSLTKGRTMGAVNNTMPYKPRSSLPSTSLRTNGINQSFFALNERNKSEPLRSGRTE